MRSTATESNGESLRAVIADDDPITRRAVRDALEDGGVVTIAEAENGRDAVDLCLHYSADVVLMDVVMPVMDGITATRALAERGAGIAVVMLSANEDEEVALVCLRAGAIGFLSKTIDLRGLPRALRAAVDGEAVISRRLATRLVRGMRGTRPDGVGVRPVRSPLTPREWEVLDLLCLELTTAEIAERLVLSNETVRSHIKSTLRKLGVHGRPEAVEAARRLRADIVPLDRATA
jgi:DNA-binding NarL/FixJ family response regulator